MNKTSIEWVKNPDGTQGYTWNPITGCLNGCPYCYARKLANGRLKSRYLDNPNIAPVSYPLPDIPASLQPFYPRFCDWRVLEPRDSSRGKGIFVCDMSDLFGIGIPEEWIKRVLKEIPICHDNRFYLLTKQPQNLIKFEFPENCWVGVTATDTKMFHNACYYLADIKASVKYLSLEPFLEWEDDSYQKRRLEEAGIKQVIIGAQTKPKKLPKWDWVLEIIMACDKAKIPVFLKGNLGLPRLSADGATPFYKKHPSGTMELRQEIPR